MMQDLTLNTSLSNNTQLAVSGIAVKCVASNIRHLNTPWQSCKIVEGKGYEGNVVLVEVTQAIGYRTIIEDQYGVDQQLYVGDKFIAVLANRHSGTSESGGIPPEGIALREGSQLHLLSASGVVGIKSGMPVGAQEPITLTCLGLVAKDSGPIDIKSLYNKQLSSLPKTAPIILVCGTSAEIGKTTTASRLVRSLVQQGHHVAGTKLTGTGRMRDIRSLRDAGANPALDFPEAGLATTYTSPERFLESTYTLFGYLNREQPEIIVTEAGGDIIEANVPTLLAHKEIMQHVKAIVLVAGDVMGMIGAVSYIRALQEHIPIYLVDPKGRNPVTTRERVAHELPDFSIFNAFNNKEVNTVTQQIMEELR
jgi:hypothetical protein